MLVAVLGRFKVRSSRSSDPSVCVDTSLLEAHVSQVVHSTPLHSQPRVSLHFYSVYGSVHVPALVLPPNGAPVSPHPLLPLSPDLHVLATFLEHCTTADLCDHLFAFRQLSSLPLGRLSNVHSKAGAYAYELEHIARAGAILEKSNRTRGEHIASAGSYIRKSWQNQRRAKVARAGASPIEQEHFAQN